LSIGLCPDPLGELIALSRPSSWICGGDSRTGKEMGNREMKGGKAKRRGERDKVPQRQFFVLTCGPVQAVFVSLYS